ncbi:efflux RND transporter periplasmic adaptor subunit [Brevibacillus ginsengisoli]|uniref:efflux RND transporter periplasmic adaptor subunit n=1 Tax=Brevibacillus ginsengisoli TaxID=363854 RepID=UPI003CE88357
MRNHLQTVTKASAQAAFICLLAASLVGCSSVATSSTIGVQKVVVQQVGKSDLKKAKMAVGRVMGDTESAVMSKIQGRVTKVLADVGQEVKAGQPLIYLDDKDYVAALESAQAGLRGAQARLEDTKNGTRSQQLIQIQGRIQSAQATLENAKFNLDRIKTLFNQGAVPQSQLDAANLAYTQAQTALQQVTQEQSMAKEGATQASLENLRATVEQMQAAVNLAEINKSNTVITAPISGKIATQNIHVGETASTSAPLLTIVSGVAVVEAYVPEDQINTLKVGQTLKVRVEQVSTEPFDAKVLAISPISNSTSKEYPVKLSLPGDRSQWKSGMYAEVTLPTNDQSAAITVPAETIVKRGDQRLVMVTDGKKAIARPVVTGATDGTTIQIVNGLQAGDKIIVVGQDELKDGDPIDVYYEKGDSK